MTDCETISIASAFYGYVPGWPDEHVTVSEDEPVAFRRCRRIADGSTTGEFVQWAPPNPVDGLVAEARSRVRLALPEVATSPPRGGHQLVGVPVWFWSADQGPVTTTAEVPGLSATLVATPVQTRFAIGGGEGEAAVDNVMLDCPDGGTPWEPDRHDGWAASDCSHAFDWNGMFTVDATVSWALTWTASDGQSGTLPAVERTSAFTLTIQEGQAVTD